jgi:RHS repeat-associated protein
VTTYDAYDVMGRTKQVSKSIVGAPLASYITQYDYDLSGKVKSISYPGASPYSVDYGYHPGTGLLSTVTGSDATVFASYPSHIASSKIKKINFGNGVETTYWYDAQSTRLTLIDTVDSAPNPLIEKFYNYSPAGDIVAIIDGIEFTPYVYKYDKLHRLISETDVWNTSSSSASVFTYEYDSNSLHGVDHITNEITETTHDFDYDGNGNLVSGYNLLNPDQPVLREISFNADNMPTSIDMGETWTASFTYDGENTRAVKESTNSTTYYINQYYEIEIDVENTIETKYVFGNNTRIAKINDTDINYFHKDHLGSTSAITGSDGLEVAPSSEFLPFGMDRNDDGQNVSDYKFTDQEQDDEIGLYNYNARLYDPALGVFVSADTVVPDLTYPQNLNRYAYCRNNPLIFFDPTGHNTVWLGGAGTESNTANYSNSIVQKMDALGVAKPEYVPISTFAGHFSNIFLFTLPNSYVENNSLASNAVTNKIISASNDEGGQRNFVGYSYGSTMAAQSALKVADSGVLVNNLVLIGSPISIDSPLFEQLTSHNKIGSVTRIDIPNDPFSDGIDLNIKIWYNMKNHFYFDNNDFNQQDQLSQAIYDIFNPTISNDAYNFSYDNYFNSNNTPDYTKIKQ